MPAAGPGHQRRAARGQPGLRPGAGPDPPPRPWPAPHRPGQDLADTAYTSRAYLRQRHLHVVTPKRADEIRNRKNRGSRGGHPPGFDPQVYKRRNSVERAINRLKQNRAVATRYDKHDYIWHGTVDIAAIRTWPHAPTQ